MASGQELNVGKAQIRTLLVRHKEQILFECQAEIEKHEFQASFDRRNVQKLSENVESKEEECHGVQVKVLQRRHQQLLYAQTLQQKSELRKVQRKSPNEMEELKKIQSSIFNIMQDEDGSRIGTLFWYLLARYRNCRMTFHPNSCSLHLQSLAVLVALLCTTLRAVVTLRTSAKR